jgi:DNA-binding transcriptional ArsR family regulator
MATSTYLRRMHRRRIIETVARCGRVSRSGLARATGMSQPTVSRIVDRLLSEHILAESADDVRSGEGVLRKPGPTVLRRRRSLGGLRRGWGWTADVRASALCRLVSASLGLPSSLSPSHQRPVAGRISHSDFCPTLAQQIEALWEPHRDKGS